MIAKAFDVQFDCFANELFRFLARATHRNAARKIRDIGPDRILPFFEDDEVSHVR